MQGRKIITGRAESPQPTWLTVLPTEAKEETHKHQEGCILRPCTASLARCLQGVEGVEGVGRQTGLQSPGSPASSSNLLSPGASPGDNLVHPEHMGLSVNVPPLANRAAAAGVLVPWLSICLAQLQLLGPAWQTPARLAAAVADVSCSRHCRCLS